MRTPLFKRILFGALTVLLVVVGYYWTQRTPVTSPRAARSQPTPVTAPDTAALDTVARETTALDTGGLNALSTPKEPPRRSPPVAPPPAPAQKSHPSADRDRAATSVQEPASEDVTGKPAPVVCDQLVMRSGDLTDAKILEIGVHEIRYRKCRRDDGPDYVVSKSDVLSIRYANGDIERFTGQ